MSKFRAHAMQFEMSEPVAKLLERLPEAERSSLMDMFSQAFQAGYGHARNIFQGKLEHHRKAHEDAIGSLSDVDGHWAGEAKHADWVPIWRRVRATLERLRSFMQQVPSVRDSIYKPVPTQPVEPKEFNATRHVLDPLHLFVVDLPEGEGLMMASTPGGMAPMIAGDVEALKQLLPLAVKMSDAQGCRFKVLKFSRREDVTDVLLGKTSPTQHLLSAGRGVEGELVERWTVGLAAAHAAESPRYVGIHQVLFGGAKTILMLSNRRQVSELIEKLSESMDLIWPDSGTPRMDFGQERN